MILLSWTLSPVGWTTVVSEQLRLSSKAINFINRENSKFNLDITYWYPADTSQPLVWSKSWINAH